MRAPFVLFWLLTFYLSIGQSYRIVVSTDFDGNVVEGSINELIAEIRKGNPVRVGWQLDFNKDKVTDFDHWVEATFITILGGHVFTQIKPIFAQGPNPAPPQIEIFSGAPLWTAVIGTNGKLLNRYVPKGNPEYKGSDDEIAEKKERLEEMTNVKTWEVATFWCVPKR